MSAPQANAGYAAVLPSEVIYDPTTADPTFVTNICNSALNYYVCLRLASPDQSGCIRPSVGPFTNIQIRDIGSQERYFWTADQSISGMNAGNVFRMIPINGAGNQFALQTLNGRTVDSYWYRNTPSRNILGYDLNTISGATIGTVNSFFIPDGRLDGSGAVMNNYLQGDKKIMDWASGTFQLGVSASGAQLSTSSVYGNLVSAYCNDGFMEMCLQGGTPGASRICYFRPTIYTTSSGAAGIPIQVPRSFLNYQDGCMAFYCNDPNSKIPESYGGTSMNLVCTAYLSALLTSTASGRYTVDMFLSPNTTNNTQNVCLIGSIGNLYSLMSDECVTYCANSNNYANCAQIRQSFCKTIMPVSASVNQNFSDLCSCFFPTEFYTARTQKTVEAISSLYPGLNDVLSTLFTDSAQPQCSYAPCQNSPYILGSMTMSGCRAVNVCLQSITANIGTATDTQLNIANQCIINDINSSSTTLTPEQQAAVDAYNNGTINDVKETSLFGKIKASFDTTTWVLLGILAAAVVIVIIIIVVLSIKKKKLPDNAFVKDQKGEIVPANYKPPPVVISYQKPTAAPSKVPVTASRAPIVAPKVAAPRPIVRR